MPLAESDRNKLYSRGFNAYRLGDFDEAIKIIKLLQEDLEVREAIHSKEQIRSNRATV